MRHVSRRFREALAGTPTWVTEVRYSNEAGQWSDPLSLVSGSVTSAATSQVRWTCSLQVRGPMNAFGSEDRLELGDDGINDYWTHLKIDHGIEFAPGDRELIGMGLYRVDTAERALNDPDLITVAGVSFEQRLIDASLPWPKTFGASDPKGRVRELIEPILPDATLYWDEDEVENDVWLPKLTVEKDRWATIDGGRSAGSVARAVGARVFTDGHGTFICAPVPSLSDAPVWRAVSGPGGVLLGSVERLTADGVKNQIIVTGESTSGSKPIGPIRVSDEDPYSRTFIGGRFGPRPMYYSSQQIVTRNQAFLSGNGILAPRLGLRRQVTFDQLHDPTKEPGDVGEVETASGIVRVILDSCTYDLLGGNLQTQTRTTVALPGGFADLPDDVEGLAA